MTGEVVAILIAGAGTLVTALTVGINLLRTGAQTRQRNLMDDLEEARDRYEHNWHQEQKLRRYYEGYARSIAADAARKGVDVPSSSPPDWVDFPGKKP